MALGWRGDMEGVPRHAVAGDLGVDLRPAPLRMFVLLEHHAAGALAHHEAVAFPVPRARCRLGPIVECGGQGARGAEPGDAEFTYRRLGAAGDHDVGIPPHDQPRRVADRVHASGTGGHHGMIRPLEAILDRDVAGGEVDQRRRDEERREPSRAAFVNLDRRLEDCLQATDAGADHHPGGAAIRLGIRQPTGILDRLAGSDHAEVDEPVHLLLVLHRDPLADVKPALGLHAGRHLASHLAWQVLGVECLNRPNTRFAVDQASPDMLDPEPEGTGNPHARHHHTPHRFGPSRAGRQAAFCFSMYSIASFTVLIFSAASSGISTPNASSKAITSSTVSRLSAPRSSMKDASGVTFASSTPRCSTTIFLTLSEISLIGCATPPEGSRSGDCPEPAPDRIRGMCVAAGGDPIGAAVSVPDEAFGRLAWFPRARQPTRALRAWPCHR